MWNSRMMTSAFQTRKQRSDDDRVIAQASAELRHSGYAELRPIKCVFEDDVLTLTGHVPSYYHKQIAQTLILPRLPNLEIRNELEVLVYRFRSDSDASLEEPLFA